MAFRGPIISRRVDEGFSSCKAKANNTRKTAFGLLLLLAIVPLLSADTYTGKCVGVHDGDTISVMKAGRAVKIRLEGIDCPEMGQDFGTKAKQFTSGMVFGKDVEVKEYNLDIYGRMVARIYIEGKDLSLELVKAGLAWHYKRYSSDPVLAEAELEARKAKRGLWSIPNPMPPWEWRRLHRRQGEAGCAGSPLLVRDAVRGGNMPHL
jgi:endonuclease YncB( thermonuclease family)